MSTSAETAKQVANSFYLEESSVQLDGAAGDLKLFRQNCNKLRELLQTAWQQKKSGQKVSPGEFATALISLKEINRRTQFRIRKARDRTTEKKLSVDALHLSLQNLLYEVAHLENEIKTCLEFRSQHEKLHLIPTKEFYEATGRTPSDETTHEETLERLYWELEQRKNLSNSCEDLRTAVESVSQEILKKRKYLASFAPKLKEMADNTLVVQEIMNLPFTKEEQQYSMAFLLPHPLYILYSYLKSYISMSGQLSRFMVEIDGDAELARAVNQVNSQHTLQDGEDSESEEVAEPNSRKLDRDEEISTDTLTTGSSMKKSTVLHPLAVILTITRPASTSGYTTRQRTNTLNAPSDSLLNVAFKLALSFAWMPRLQMVTVRMHLEPDVKNNGAVSKSGCDLLCSENLLSNLFWGCDAPGFEQGSADTPVPHSSSSGQILWDACGLVGRPYSWAQQLCGLHCYPDKSDGSSKNGLWVKTTGNSTLPDDGSDDLASNGASSARFGQIDSWLHAVEKRLSDRIYLVKELAEIESGQPSLSPEQQTLIPATSDVHLRNWRRSSYETLKTVPRAQAHIDLKLIQESDAIFQCEFFQDDQECASVWVALSPEYPLRAPILVIDDTQMKSKRTSKATLPVSDLQLQELEAEVNCYWHEFFESNLSGSSVSKKPKIEADSPLKWRSNILSCQLVRCSACLHALWIGHSSDSDISAPVSRSVRYPTRTQPLRYLPSLGAFAHR
ncbi:unnamed protein product [Calicophoron daubneyi]|uniref:THO complex subunit 5 n=1 Tax=Calicophoron daubneyi TaxID=300641 RepID=A0AAV2U2H1_CALDB